jgi:hypothetical protein
VHRKSITILVECQFPDTQVGGEGASDCNKTDSLQSLEVQFLADTVAGKFSERQPHRLPAGGGLESQTSPVRRCRLYSWLLPYTFSNNPW